jgi:hypothetical protein
MAEWHRQGVLAIACCRAEKAYVPTSWFCCEWRNETSDAAAAFCDGQTPYSHEGCGSLADVSYASADVRSVITTEKFGVIC